MTPDEALMVEAARRGLLPDKPVATPSFGDRAANVGLGVLRGARDPIDAGAQLLTRGLEAIAPSGSSFETFMKGERQKVEAINRDAEAQYQGARLGKGFDPARLVGNVAATIPMTAALPATIGGSAIAGGAAAGGAMGALQPVQGEDQSAGDFWTAKAKQTGTGAVLGGGVSAAGKAISRVIQPKSSPEVQALMDIGVSPTPGQVMGGGLKRVEEAATSIPLVGDAIKRAQTRAVEDFNRGTINKALEPIGEKLSNKTLVGREAIEEAGRKVSAAYDDILPKLTAKADQQFVTQMNSIVDLAKNLPGERSKQFMSIVSDNLISRFNPNTKTISGETLKQAESELGRLAAQYRGSAVADERLLGSALQETVSTLRGLVERSNPALAPRLSAINNSYAQLLRLENAAGRLGSKDGVFSPAALTGAVRQMDSSLRHRAFARGDAMLQDIAEAGQKVLGPRLPDSGTSTRAMIGGGVLAGASGGAGAVAGFNPIAAAGLGAGLLGGYTPIGQRVTASLLARRPEAAATLSQAIEDALPYIVSGAGSYGGRR